MNEQEFKNVVRNGFDEASRGYDNPPMRFFDKSAARLVELSPLKGHEDVLDVAAGTGKVSLAAAKRLKTGRVIAVDLSEGMLDRARAKARDEGVTNVQFKHEDVDAADLGEASYDVVFCSFGVFFFSDMHTLVKKLSRALKPGGFLAVTSFADGSFKPLSDLTLERFKSYGIKLPESYTWQRLDSHQKHFDLFNSTGLKSISSRTEPMGYDLGSADEWWDIVYFTGFRSFLNQLSAQEAERYKREHLHEIAQTAGSKGIRLKVDVIFTIAYK